MGERPSADKFNAVNKYFSRGMIELAGAIGDIHDKGWPYHTLDGVGKGIGAPWNLTGAGNKARDLDIVNLARLIGPASNLNARMFTNVELEMKVIQEQIPDGVFEFETSYPMRGFPSFTGLTAVGSEFTDTAQFTMSGNKKIRFSSATTGGMIATYDTRPSNYHGGVDYQFAGFNVIPDPNQITGLTIAETQNSREYLIEFPTIQAQQSGLVDLNDSTLGTADEFNNAKQYAFPKWLNDIMANAENKKIPHNYIYLKNRITREIFKDAEYTWESASKLLVSNVDICEENGSIPGDDYCIITVGANITNYIDDIRLKLFKHDHSGMFGEPLVSIKHLADKYEFKPPSGIYGPSGLPWNQLPMYLHRDGYVTDSNGNNGDNAMRGDLMMGLISFDPLGTDLIANGDSNSSSHNILFGNNQCRIQNWLGNLVIESNISGEGDIEMISRRKFIRNAGTEIADAAPIINIIGRDQLSLRGDLTTIEDLTRKEFLKVDTATKDVTVNEGFVFEEFEPTELDGNYHPSDLLNKKHFHKEGIAAKKMSSVHAVFTINSNYRDALKLDELGNLEANSPFTLMQDSVTNWVEKVYLLDETEANLSQHRWGWEAVYTSDNASVQYSLNLGGNPFMTQGYRTAQYNLYSSQTVVPDNIDSFLILSDPRSMNNSYEIGLSTVLNSLKDDGSGSYEIDESVHVLHLPPTGEPNQLTGAGFINEYEPHYTLIELNRALSYERLHQDSNEELENTFYFKVNLPTVFDDPSLNKGYFPRFIIRFEYSGRIDDNTYYSNNTCIAKPLTALLLNSITEVNVVTLNGRTLDETETAPMLLNISGESDSYDRTDYEIVNSSIIDETLVSSWIRDGGRSKLGFNEGIKGWDATSPGGPYAYSEHIINEYTVGAFSTNQFKANTWYKVEERIFRGKVWLEITG